MVSAMDDSPVSGTSARARCPRDAVYRATTCDVVPRRPQDGHGVATQNGQTSGT
ncbi:Uncharacterised protein [Mycobacteroides abscessus]|nr:Uncharacterised protein [Mycobacteroides abscessus]